MKIYRLETIQTFPITLAKAWEFFSDPRNLSTITPPELGFEIMSDLPQRVYAGMIITYRVRPFLGIPVTWVTEITNVAEPYLFIDEQRVGPYRLWHHEHHFREIAGGVEIRDLVQYALPFVIFGRLVHALVVQRSLTRIFGYRRGKLEGLFGRVT